MSDTDFNAPSPSEWGRRQIIEQNQTGQPRYHYVALQPDDFLNPLPGDEFFEGEQHAHDVRQLRGILRHTLRVHPTLTSFSGVKFIWPDPQLSQPRPDVAVVPNVQERDRPRTLFDVSEEGTAPQVIVEVASPRFAHYDHNEKRELYAATGVQEYFIIEILPSMHREHAYRLHGYTLEEGRYLPIEPDATGRLHSRILRIAFSLQPATYVVSSTRTGRPIVPTAEDLQDDSEIRAEAAFRAHSIASQLRLN
jgi:Uma2 family endonuclease